MAMVKLVAFTSLAAPATASTIGEVSLPDACAEAAIAAAAMLSGAVVADPEGAGEAAGAGVAGAVTIATAMADGSSGMSGVEAVAVPASGVCPDVASTESSEVVPDLVCFDGFSAG